MQNRERRVPRFKFSPNDDCLKKGEKATIDACAWLLIPHGAKFTSVTEKFLKGILRRAIEMDFTRRDFASRNQPLHFAITSRVNAGRAISSLVIARVKLPYRHHWQRPSDYVSRILGILHILRIETEVSLVFTHR